MSAIIKADLDTARLHQIAQDIIAQALRNNATQAEVGIAFNNGFSVTARDGEVETVEYSHDKVVEITVHAGKRTGSASLSDLRPEAIRAAVEAACHIAKFTDEDPAAGLAEKHELATRYPELELNFPWSMSVEKAIEMACECERIARNQDKRILSAEASNVATSNAWNLYANSEGFIGSFPYTRHEISCILVARDGNDMQRDYSYTVAADPQLLRSVPFVAKEAAERTVNRLGAQRLHTMKTPVIFAASEARGLLGHFCSAISGGALYRKGSFLLDHLGKKIFPDFVHIQEFPHLPRALGSASFDDDGVLTRDNVFVEDGMLRNYILGVYSARKLGMKTTGNSGGARNLTIRAGQNDLSALIKKMDKGLLITEMMGSGVSILTGDYSRGVGGFWIENGEIQYPVHEITVAGRLQDMYANIIDIGNDVDTRGNILTGSILIEEMTVAGV